MFGDGRNLQMSSVVDQRIEPLEKRMQDAETGLEELRNMVKSLEAKANKVEMMASSSSVHGTNECFSSVPDRRMAVLAEARRIQANGGFAGAQHLHKNITGEFWGMTRTDLERSFFRKVGEMLTFGEIHNTGKRLYPQEKFDDPLIGPNMYQINAQVIKPVTAGKMAEPQAGPRSEALEDLEFPGVSWALMCNPVGHRCTIFITHAWAEGVHEFEEHVFSKWPTGQGPRGAQHAAYICFLSNPQNLDISELLQDIDSSPFKVALKGMPERGLMIVSTTQATPIHNRLWCVAELHWAIEQGTPIVVAGKSTELALNSEDAAKHTAEVVKAKKNEVKTMAVSVVLLDVLACILTCVVPIGLTAWMLSEYMSLSSELTPDFDATSAADAMDTDYTAQIDQMESKMYAKLMLVEIVYISVCLCSCCLGCSSVAGAAFLVKKKDDKARAAAQSMGDGHLIDIRKAECSNEEDAIKIRSVIAGKEDKINAELGKLMLQEKKIDAELGKLIVQDAKNGLGV